MDSKYSIFNGRNGSANTPVSLKFNLKRKWTSPATPNHSNNTFKKHCNNNNGSNGHNGKSNGGGGGHTPKAVPQLSLMDQRRSLPVFQVRQK